MIGRVETTLGNSLSEQLASLRGALSTSRIRRRCHNGYSKVLSQWTSRRNDSTLLKMLQLALFWSFCSIFCKASFFVAQEWYLGIKVHSWLRWMLLLKLQYLRSSTRETPLYLRTNFRSLGNFWDDSRGAGTIQNILLLVHDIHCKQNAKLHSHSTNQMLTRCWEDTTKLRRNLKNLVRQLAAHDDCDSSVRKYL